MVLRAMVTAVLPFWVVSLRSATDLPQHLSQIAMRRIIGWRILACWVLPWNYVKIAEPVSDEA